VTYFESTVHLYAYCVLRAGTICQITADVASWHSRTPPQETETKAFSSLHSCSISKTGIERSPSISATCFRFHIIAGHWSAWSVKTRQVASASIMFGHDKSLSCAGLCFRSCGWVPSWLKHWHVSIWVPWEMPSTKKKANSVAWVRERTIPTDRQPLVGEYSANVFR
jgi:hypothetical protein